LRYQNVTWYGVLLLIGGLLMTPVSAGEIWNVTTADAATDVGRFSSLAIGIDDIPAISYLDYDANNLKYAWNDGNGWQTTTVDANKSVGYHTSLVLDAENHAAISYYDAINEDLKYARYDGADWLITTVDTAGAVGWYTSLAWDNNGHPAISYQNFSQLDLKYAWNDGTGWETVTVDAGESVGWYSSLAFDAGGAPAISYSDITNSELKYARYEGTEWKISTIDDSGITGEYVSLAFDTTGHPAVSYTDSSTGELKYAHHDGTEWHISTIDIPEVISEYTSLAFDTAGHPAISYTDAATGDLKYALHDGTEWQITTIDTGAGKFEYTALAFDTDGHPAISYSDETTGTLKYASATFTGAVQVTSVPAGAAIWIDGADTGKITNSTIPLTPDDYTVNVRLTGYEEPVAQVVTVTDGTTGNVAFNLVPIPEPQGNLTVTSVPAGAAIWIDGADTGEITDHNFALTPGDYNVYVRLAGYEQPVAQTITVTDKTTVNAAFNLVPIPEPQGNLTVTSVPAGAAIWIDGVDTGEITDHNFALAPGDYTVNVRLAGYEEPDTQTVTVTDGTNVNATFTLIPLPVNVTVTLSAGWNMISVPVANATIILPSEAGSVYRYNVSVYELVEDPASVLPGEGIWVSAMAPCTLTFTGQRLDCYTEPVPSGWNMIGSCTEMMPFTDHLTSDPAEALTDQIYTYDTESGTYVKPASCNPGCGYWVLTSTGCEVCLT
jgi:PEGA domain-containing protein